MRFPDDVTDDVRKRLSRAEGQLRMIDDAIASASAEPLAKAERIAEPCDGRAHVRIDQNRDDWGSRCRTIRNHDVLRS